MDMNELLEKASAGSVEDAMALATALVGRFETELMELPAVDGLRNLAFALTELFAGEERMARELDLLVELMSAREVCAATAPTLSQEYETYLQQTAQLKAQAQKIAQYEERLCRCVDAGQLEELKKRNETQEQTIRKLRGLLKEKDEPRPSPTEEKLQKALENEKRLNDVRVERLAELEKEKWLLAREKQTLEQEKQSLEKKLQMLLTAQQPQVGRSQFIDELREKTTQQEKAIRSYQGQQRLLLHGLEGLYMLDLRNNMLKGAGMMDGLRIVGAGASRVKTVMGYRGRDFCIPDRRFYPSLKRILVSEDVVRLLAKRETQEALGGLEIFFAKRDCVISIAPSALKNVHIWAIPGGNIQSFAGDNGIAFTALE